MQNDCELVCRQPSPDNKLAFPPYAINNLHNKVALGSKTLPMTAQHADGQLQYNTHNLYGLSEAAATRWALKNITGRRPFILSRCAQALDCVAELLCWTVDCMAASAALLNMHVFLQSV